MEINTAPIPFSPSAEAQTSGLDQQQSVAQDIQALALAVQRAAEGLARWQVHGFEQISDVSLTGAEVTLLQLIGDEGKPKAIKELAAATNRIDIPNIQYSLRKLGAAGLTCKQGAGRSGVSYRLTERGAEVLDGLLRQRAALARRVQVSHGDLAQQLRATRNALDSLSKAYGDALHDTLEPVGA